MDAATLDTKCLDYQRMQERWKLILDLLGGSKQMRERSTIWLPQHEFEAAKNYERRKKYAYLHPGFEQALETISSRPFEQTVKVVLPEEAAVPGWLQTIIDDMDLAGSDLTSFLAQVFRMGWKFGLAHVLPRFPASAPTENARDEAASGARPFFELLSPTKLIGWRWRMESGKVVMEHIRVLETVREPDGAWGEKRVQQVRVWTETEWAIYRAGGRGESWTKANGGPHTFGEVPLRTYYVREAGEDDAASGDEGFSGVLTAIPPLEAIADLNLAHWRSTSDQRSILTSARVPILFGKQLGDRKANEPLPVGPNSLVESTDKDGDLRYVEHTGAAIQSGESDLARLEAQMQVLGMQPFASKVEVTATKENRDEARSTSQIKRSIRELETFGISLLEAAAKWTNEELPEGLSIKVFDDFALLERAAEDMLTLIQLRREGALTRKTLLEEAKRRGKVSESVDVADEISTAETETPLGLLGVGAGFGDGGGIAGAGDGQ